MDRVGPRDSQRGATCPGFLPLRFAVSIVVSAALAFTVALPAAASASQTLTVTIAGTGTGTVTSSPSGFVNCSATCSVSIPDNTVVFLTGAAGANTAAVAWTGCEAVTLEEKCKVTMSSAKSVTAKFDILQRELKVTKAGSGSGTVESSPSGIECGATCSTSYAIGTVVTLSAVSGPNTLPVAWSGCAKTIEVGGEEECEVTMSGAKAVTATFNLKQVQLAVTEFGSGTGTVTSSPAGISCGATCSASFDQDSTVTLTGASGLHSQVVQWSGCDSVVLHKCLVKMSAARSVTATFELEPGFSLYTLTVTKGGTGSGTVTSSPVGIDCGSSCSTEVLSKTKVTLFATPAPGSVFAHWSGGTCSGTDPCERKINSTRTVKAVFNATGTRTLAIAMTGSGAGIVKSKARGIECTASCSPSIAAGAKVSLTAVPATGSTFSGWSGACSGTSTCKVQMSEAHSVTATFAKVSTPSSIGAVTIAKSAKVKGGKAFVGIRCSGPSSCRGSLRLLAKLGRKGGSAAIGSATFSLAPGSSTTLKIKLSAGAKQLLKSAGQLRARVSGVGIQARSLRLKL
jgi:hypothetical protein